MRSAENKAIMLFYTAVLSHIAPFSLIWCTFDNMVQTSL